MSFISQALQSVLSEILAPPPSTMEGRYIRVLALLEEVETFASDGASKGEFPHCLAVELAEVKQGVLDEFARANSKNALAEIRRRAVEAGEVVRSQRGGEGNG